MTARFAFVDVILVDLVQVAVMDVVDMVVMRDGHVPTAGTVPMVVTGVLTMVGGNAHVYPRETCRPKSGDECDVGTLKERYSSCFSRSPS